MAEPVTIETRDRASIFNKTLNEWFEGWQAVFRPPALYKPINIATATTHTIIPGVSRKRIRIVSFFFTVGGEVNITLYDGPNAMSGPMDFGGASEPRGTVTPFPYSPVELGEGEGFKIKLSAAVQVSGTVCYYYQ